MAMVSRGWWARALALGTLALLLQQVAVPYALHLPGGTMTDGSLVHLHAGLILAIAMLDRDRRVLLLVSALVFIGWSIRAWVRDYPASAMLWGLANAIFGYVWAVLCARWMGWPRPIERQHIEREDLPRTFLLGMILYPSGIALFWGMVITGPNVPEHIATLLQMVLAKYFGVAIVALPLLVAWTGRHRLAEPVTGSRLRWALLLAIAMVGSVWVGSAVRSIPAQGAQDLVLMDYRLTLFAALAWCMLHLRPLYSMPLLSVAMFALVHSLGSTASYSVTALGFLNLLHLAVECGILVTAMLYFHVADRDARDLSLRLDQELQRDAVTRLPNLNAINRRLRALPPTRREIGCLLLDKTDTLAPGFGLATQAQLMNSVAANLTDLAEPYYIGTSQFALLPGPGAGADVWDRLVARIERLEIDSDSRPIRLLPYLGVAECVPGDQESVDLALLTASHLAYEARRRNELHPLYATDAEASSRIGQRLFEAAEALASLRNERVVLHFQPIRPLSEAAIARSGIGEVHGEVLCRLRNAEGALLRPDKFLAAIEGAGRGVELDLAVLRALFAWLREHPPLPARVGRIAVNLTGQSLASPSFRRQLSAMLDDSPLPPSRLCFEIIETAAIVSPAEVNAFLGELRARGCSIAIDDFGVGMQSFERLRDLPVDMIKIDGSFIRNVAQRGRDHALVQASVAVARAFGAMTVAEYVEDEDTVACLRELGIDWIQGYLISRPMPIEEAFARA